MTDLHEHHEQLRAWARGVYDCEAATELLIRAGFARPSDPWIETDGWVNFGAIAEHSGGYSGGQQRVLRIAAAIGGARPSDLAEDLPGLDREHLALVLAAIAHAGGNHEHSDLHTNGNGTITGLPPLYPWRALPPDRGHGVCQ